MIRTMKRLALAGVMAVTAFGLSGCIGEKAEVPPASVGMILGKNGYQGDIIPPSRFRLPFCVTQCDKLVVIEAGDVGMKEQVKVLMPQDNLDLTVDVRFTVALSDEKDQILSIFDRVLPTRLSSGNYGISLPMIYETYGISIVRNVVRSKLSTYTIAEIASNQEQVSEVLRRAVSEELGKTPLDLKQFGLANIEYPSVVTESREANMQRKLEIEAEQAKAQIEIRKAQARLEVARAQREADILEAQTVAEQNRILAEGVTPEVIRFKELEVMKAMAANGNTIFFPIDMLGTNSQGLSTRVMLEGMNR